MQGRLTAEVFRTVAFSVLCDCRYQCMGAEVVAFNVYVGDVVSMSRIIYVTFFGQIGSTFSDSSPQSDVTCHSWRNVVICTLNFANTPCFESTSFPLSLSLPRSLAPRSLAPSLPRSLAPSLPRSLAPSLPRSLAPSFARSLAPSLPRSLAPSLPRSVAPSLRRSVVPSLPRSLAPSLPRSLAPSLSRSLAPSLRRSLASSLPPSIFW